ncbi:MAG: DUF2231 domain-containing protein [Acidimicrobiales bacterium]
MLESIGELPSHPLFVHAPVVLMPLLALFAVALLARPSWRRRVGLALPLLSVGLAIATFLARESGEELKDLLGDFAPNTDKHESLANTALVMIVVLLVMSTAMVVADRWVRRGGPAWVSQAAIVLLGLSVVFAGLATIWMFRAGHEGARLVWKGTVQSMAVLPMK